MADWSGVKTDPSQINGGKEYEAQKDRVSIEAFNAIVNNSIYASKASAEALEKAESAFEGNGTIVRVGGVSKGYVDFDSDPQTQLNAVKSKFYHLEQAYGGEVGQSIVGVDGGTIEKIWCFGNLGDVVLDIPRDGVYEITTYLSCASTNGADANILFYVDGVKIGKQLPVMDSHFTFVPYTEFVTLTAGRHTICVYGGCHRVGITMKLRDYAQQQLFIKEL
jgi:hypothetical protein